MAKNEFLPFGTGANANVLSNADYQALAARVSGFSSGVAKSEELNTAWRQASVMAAVLGQFIADKSGNDVLDNGNLVTLQNSLLAALSAQAVGRLLNIRVFTASGTYTPTPGAKKIRAKVWGAGGAGGGTQAVTTAQSAVAGGGSSGAYSEAWMDATSLNVIVGLGGIGSSTSDGANGGTSSVGSVSAPGGVGGSYGTASSVFPFGAAPRNPPVGTGGSIVNAPGNVASMGFTWSNGGAIRSMGGQSSVGASQYSAAALGYSAGGAGAVAAGQNGAVANQAGYNGAPGLVIVEEYA
ncbi:MULTISPECIES: glycine-rich domain-containing protein [unclassified Serratia (in: enterobacteria)]|uniref:glycine-rich domain-containing protein n=1 Tax=unclassified Serratia (in: enterobacteria) TaxID=2647522 RepID=UPI000500E2DA|nr:MULTISPECIES: hypothetical protein [unclassified Serratia (in: enterobacteria)]KFK92014.1 hypothetical protein JV45_23230 [Serratia sp. Ag2]KFK98415.1 hypothetical protein IV04_12600 [Serratia sp. Ag1]